MALSGTITGSCDNGHYSLTCEWSATQNVNNNTSTITAIVYLNGNGWATDSSYWDCTINGTQVTDNKSAYIGGKTELGRRTWTVNHNSNGTCSTTISFSYSNGLSSSGTYTTKSGSGSGSITLNTIARSSSVSTTNGNIGSNITISISRASSSFTHTLRYSFHNLNETIANGVGTSYTWTIPTKFYAQIPNAKSSWGTIYCDTYNGSTLIGTTSCTFNAYVTNSNPTLSPFVRDTNSTTLALTGDENKFIKYYSSANFSVNASGVNSATISSTRVKVGSKSTSSSTGTFQNVDSASFVFTATDSRGFSTSKTVNKTLINYIYPTCNLYTSLSADGVLRIKVSGNYFNGSFGKANNSLQVAYRYRLSNGSYGGWNYITPSFSGNSYSVAQTVEGLDYDKEYVVQAWCGDVFYTNGTNGGYYSIERRVFSKPIFDWGESDFNFNVPVYVGGKEMFHNGNCQFSSSGNCQTWRFANGMQVSTIRVYGTWDVTTAWGAVYSSPHISGQNFDVPFLEPPKVTINAYNENNTAIMICSTSASTTTATGAVYLWKPVSQSGVKTWIEYIAIGRWK